MIPLTTPRQVQTYDVMRRRVRLLMVTTEIADGVATLTINRPHRLNAITGQSMDELHEAIDQAAVKEEVRSIVLTGAGRGFCSGFDLIDLDTTVDDLHDEIPRAMVENLNPLCEAIVQSTTPIVAAVNGPCVGGGLGLALLADVTIAAKSAYFLVPQVQTLGIVPDAGATWILARHAGRARALGMSLTGERISAERAVQWGLIWRCVDDADLMTAARAVATAISAAPEAAVATRTLIDTVTSTGPANQLASEAYE